MKPICFIVMPYQKKRDALGREIDFDDIYHRLIKPGVEQAGLEAFRSDEELYGGTIHKSMFEHLMLADYAVVGLTIANPNVYYELGMRHGLRPHSTILMMAFGTNLPFNLGGQRALEYSMSDGGTLVDDSLVPDVAALQQRLETARERKDDSPFYQYVTDWPRPDLTHLRADQYQQRVRYAESRKTQLRQAREAGDLLAAEGLQNELGKLHDAEPGIVVDLFLTYRDLKAYQHMVDLVDVMSPTVANTKLVQEQLGFALNRLGLRSEAERVLTSLIDKYGPSAETCGLLGRVHKDRWRDALAKGQDLVAEGHLDEAIRQYLKGFEADWRDHYPGINAVSLMDIKGDPAKDELVPIVRYALKRKIATGERDYWDYAGLLEADIIVDDADSARTSLKAALPLCHQTWMAESTLDQLVDLRRAREARGADVSLIDQVREAMQSFVDDAET